MTQFSFKKNPILSSILMLFVVSAILIYFTESGPNSYCENSCALYGKCTYEDGICVARGNDCIGSSECKIYGMCNAKQGLCKAISDQSCAQSNVCLLQGKCTHNDGVCIASIRGCLDTPRCKKFGWCSEVNDSCIAKKQSDCSQSQLCLNENKCFALAGNCIEPAKWISILQTLLSRIFLNWMG